MVTVAGVRFKKAGKIYYFDPAGLPVECGTNVIVETARGMEFGTVISGIK
ncbi:MAG TPA: stage 0 sporulation protein, partial [Clostridiales bacterium]|nr:stage 0 sporulation protein [Clostridiales bacterium]